MDTLKSLLALFFCVVGFIAFFICLFSTKSIFASFFIALIFVFISFLFMQSLSQETKDTFATLDRLKEYEKMNGGYKCPNCGKMAGHQIGALSKSVSVGTLGLASNKIGKSYTCENCKYMW